ncbi:MlaD family protein [Nocardia brasiliensis]|uniref:MlaD family protein n=1 Tax=Nocardia brasiliensis TaxID=37326 RepID=UPI0033CC86D6
MRRLTTPFTRLFRGGDERMDEIRWGVAGVLAVTVLLTVCAVCYLLPRGKTTYSALLTEAGTVKVGDDIRVAGIPVGAVTAVELLPDQVRMRFTVDDGVAVGDVSSLEIRMLTAVGGHYVALLPAGAKPLGDNVIPPERVRLPYSLMRTFQDAATPLDRVDATVLRRNLAAVEQSLSDSPDALHRLNSALTTLVGTFEQQRGDVAAALGAAEEYLGTLDGATSTIGTLIRRIGAVENILIERRDEINAAVPLTVRLLARIAALEPSYRSTLQPLVDELARTVPIMRDLGLRLGDMLAAVDGLSTRAAALAGGDEIILDRSATVCVPLPDRGC